MISRYQIENGIGGTDSFAIIGLQNRLPITKQLSLELGLNIVSICGIRRQL